MGCGTSPKPSAAPAGDRLSVPSAGLWGVELHQFGANDRRMRPFSTLCGPMGCGTTARLAAPAISHDFQYPLRAYGVWNRCGHPEGYVLAALSVPSAGLWGVEQLVTGMALSGVTTFSTLCGPMGCGTSGALGRGAARRVFQYPLRAYGVWNQTHLPASRCTYDLSVPSAGLWGVELQQALDVAVDEELSVPSAGLWGVEPASRAVMRSGAVLSVPSAGLWGVEPSSAARRRAATGLSVPSAGLWGVELRRFVVFVVLVRPFSTLCGPMGCGTRHAVLRRGCGRPFSTLCGPMGCGTRVATPAKFPQWGFQYPLRAYGVWNVHVLRERCAKLHFQYPLRAYGVWNA